MNKVIIPAGSGASTVLSPDLYSFMRTFGMGPFKDIDPPADGRLLRFRIEGDKPGSKNGWIVNHGDDLAIFGNWKTGESYKWRRERGRPPTPQEREQECRVMLAAQERLAVEQEALRARAREKAALLWKLARPAQIGGRHEF